MPKFKCQECSHIFDVDRIPKIDRGSDAPTVNDYSGNFFWGPRDLGTVHQHSPADSGWAPAGTENYDGVSSNVMMSSFNSFMHKQSNLSKAAHCGPCSVLKMEVLHILIDLYYKDNSLFPEEVIEELSVAATELNIDNFNDILESVITEYLEEKAEKVGDKLPKLKNLLVALKDISPKLGKDIEVVDKQENVDKEASSHVQNINGVRVYRNPQPEQAVNLFRHSKEQALRYIATEYGDIYMWDAFDVEHSQMAEDLGLTDDPNWYDGAGTIISEKQAYERAKTFNPSSLEPQVANLKQAAKEVPALSNKVVTDLIPMFVDKTEPPDHKCKTCSFKIEKDGKATCVIMKGEINLEKGSCNYWSEREVPQNANSSKMERKTAGYVEVDGLINCSTCSYYEHDFCKLWQGSVKDEQCCMAWEGTTTKEASINFQQAMEKATKELMGECKLNDIKDISGGYCEDWVATVKKYFPNIKRVDYSIGKYIPHSVIEYNGKFYDSETPQGVSSLDELPFSKRYVNEGPIALEDYTKEGSLNKQANPPSRFWIAPNGKEFDAGTNHGAWIKVNKDLLDKQYGIKNPNLGYVWDALLNNGWVRVSNEPAGTGFQIQVKNLKSLPSFLDDFVSQNFNEGNRIEMGDQSGNLVQIYNPFPSLQKAVNRALSLRQTANANLKQTSLLDEVLDQTTQDAIAAEYGPSMLIALRFYNDAARYGQSPDRAMAYALEEVKRMHRPLEQRKFLEVLDTYFQ